MAAFSLGLDTQPMEAKAVEALTHGDIGQFEPKRDGFRCLAFNLGGRSAFGRCSPSEVLKWQKKMK